MQTNPQLFQQAFAGMVFESAILRQGHESQAKQMTHHCTWLLSCIALWGLMIVMSLFGQDSRQSRHPVNWNPFRTILLQQRETWTIIDIRHWSDAWERDTVLNCSGWRYSIQINATWLPCHILKFWGFGFLSISIATINDFWISSPGTCCRRAFSGDPWCLAVGNSALCWESWKCNWWLCIWYVIHAYIYIYIHIFIYYILYIIDIIYILHTYIYIYIAADPRQALGSKFEPEIWGPGIASHGFFLDRVKAGIQIHTALNKNKQHIIANYWAFNTMLFIYIYIYTSFCFFCPVEITCFFAQEPSNIRNAMFCWMSEFGTCSGQALDQRTASQGRQPSSQRFTEVQGKASMSVSFWTQQQIVKTGSTDYTLSRIFQSVFYTVSKVLACLETHQGQVGLISSHIGSVLPGSLAIEVRWILTFVWGQNPYQVQTRMGMQSWMQSCFSWCPTWKDSEYLEHWELRRIMRLRASRLNLP